MRLYLLPKTFKGQPSLEIKGKDFVYLTRSLRLKEKQIITGRDREGKLWDLCIEKIGKDSCLLSAQKAETAQERTDALPQTGPKKTIILYQCLPKGRKADDIIKKATEAGVSAIVLVKSRNCVANLEGKEMTRIERYDAMVTEAIQQSGSMVPTTVSGVIDISEIPDDFEKRTSGLKRLGLVLHQSKIENQNNDLLECLKGFDGAVALVVGPEGGLEQGECQALIDRSFKAVVLKTNILRCETASIYAIGAVQTIIESSCR
ncbi:MAG: RsmE family RNA methyltransferase [Spirochaetales bacterium]|nr:RsmE family RNA methyltransferase [Spirochaetales bacterium]